MNRVETSVRSVQRHTRQYKKLRLIIQLDVQNDWIEFLNLYLAKLRLDEQINKDYTEVARLARANRYQIQRTN